MLIDEFINFQHLECSQDFVWPQRNLTDALRYHRLCFLGFVFIGLFGLRNPYLFSSKLIMFPGGHNTDVYSPHIENLKEKLDQNPTQGSNEFILGF